MCLWDRFCHDKRSNVELFVVPVVTIQTSYTCFHCTRPRARLYCDAELRCEVTSVSHLFTRCLRKSCLITMKKRRLSRTSCSCWETQWSCRTSRGETHFPHEPHQCLSVFYQSGDRCASEFAGVVHLLRCLPQVSRRSGCVTWSNWFSVCVHRAQTAGAHVPCVYQAALHGGRCTAGTGHDNNKQEMNEEQPA